MRDRTLIATKDHVIIMDASVGVGAEISSIDFGAFHSTLKHMYSIGFLMEGRIQTFNGSAPNWKKGNLAEGPVLNNNVNLNRGGAAASEKMVGFQVMPRLGGVGKRSTFGLWLATKDEIDFLMQNPEASLTIATGCDLNIYRNLDTFDYELEDETIENQGE